MKKSRKGKAAPVPRKAASATLTVRLSGGPSRQHIGYRGCVLTKAQWTQLLAEINVRAVTHSAKGSCDYVIVPENGRASFSALQDSGIYDGQQGQRTIGTGSIADFARDELSIAQHTKLDQLVDAIMNISKGSPASSTKKRAPSLKRAPSVKHARSRMTVSNKKKKELQSSSKKSRSHFAPPPPPSPSRSSQSSFKRTQSRSMSPVRSRASSMQTVGSSTKEVSMDRLAEQIETLLLHAGMRVNIERSPGVAFNQATLFLPQ